MPLAAFHPVVVQWFRDRFADSTDAQRLGWPHIVAGRDALIAAPTGSGKTLAAFLASIDRLLRLALDGRLPDETRVLYVSPLKALSHDVERNLTGPLHETIERAAAASERRTPGHRGAIGKPVGRRSPQHTGASIVGDAGPMTFYVGKISMTNNKPRKASTTPAARVARDRGEATIYSSE